MMKWLTHLCWVVLVISLPLLGIAQIIAGYIGIQNGLGAAWALAALFALFWFRIALPITIGAFFGAMNVWQWHWALAALFAAPGLLVAFPGMLSLAIGSALAIFKRDKLPFR